MYPAISSSWNKVASTDTRWPNQSSVWTSPSTPVEGNEERVARHQDGSHLGERPHGGAALQVNERVEGDGPRQGTVGKVQRQHIALVEADRRIEVAGEGDHRGREVEAENVGFQRGTSTAQDASAGFRPNQGRAASSWAPRRKSVASSP